MKTTVLVLDGLDCPNCAEKIASSVRKLDGVSGADMDFINKKLSVAHDSKEDAVFAQVKKIVGSLEPDVKVRLWEDAPPEEEPDHTVDIVRLAVAVSLFALSYLFHGVPHHVMLAVSYLAAGYDVLLEAVRNIFKGRPFDENFLMAVASVGAMIIGEMNEGAAVMIFYQVGELFQSIAVERSGKSIRKLMELKPESANLKVGDEIKEVPPEQVQIGDVILLKPGERVPLDGVLLSSAASFDTSALTGESLPAEMTAGDEILSGSINLNTAAELRVTSRYADSTVAKLLDMVRNSSAKKAKTEKFITRFARVYTPLVVVAALLLAIIPSVLTGFAHTSEWVYRALVFLVISCPCALVISVPLSFFAGIGAASANGILIKGAKSIEAVASCEAVALDKTGTVTQGIFKVKSVEPFNISETQLLEIACAAESNSDHPIAKSVVRYCGKVPAKKLDFAGETAGSGVTGSLDGKKILCGNEKLLRENGVEIPPLENTAMTSVMVASDGRYCGRILLGDEIKESSPEAVKRLKKCGVKRVVMLTGDKQAIAEEIAAQAGIDEVRAGLLPQGKVKAVEQLIEETSGTVAFVGDGINDAPVIARADVGVAMGGLGSDAAIEAADMVLMNDDVTRLPDAVRISKKTMSIVRQNIIFALGVKAAVLLLGAMGIAGMWMAVFADVGVSFIAILNSLRAMRYKPASCTE